MNCDCCGKSLGETGRLERDEYNNLVCVDCYKEIQGDNDEENEIVDLLERIYELMEDNN